MLHSLPMENIALINLLMVLLYDTDIKKVRQYKRVCSVGIIKNLIKTLFTGKIPAF